LARVNYQRDKRQKDLARQRKQEEKRQKRLNRDAKPDAAEETLAVPLEGEAGTDTPE